ncbi:hypothetical protein M8494_25240 [Serratia ureilytica]
MTSVAIMTAGMQFAAQSDQANRHDHGAKARAISGKWSTAIYADGEDDRQLFHRFPSRWRPLWPCCCWASIWPATGTLRRCGGKKSEIVGAG